MLRNHAAAGQKVAHRRAGGLILVAPLSSAAARRVPPAARVRSPPRQRAMHAGATFCRTGWSTWAGARLQ